MQLDRQYIFRPQYYTIIINTAFIKTKKDILNNNFVIFFMSSRSVIQLKRTWIGITCQDKTKRLNCSISIINIDE